VTAKLLLLGRLQTMV